MFIHFKQILLKIGSLWLKTILKFIYNSLLFNLLLVLQNSLFLEVRSDNHKYFLCALNLLHSVAYSIYLLNHLCWGHLKIVTFKNKSTKTPAKVCRAETCTFVCRETSSSLQKGWLYQFDHQTTSWPLLANGSFMLSCINRL